MDCSLEVTKSEVYAISYSNTETEGDKQQSHLSGLPGTLDSDPQHISPSDLLHERQYDGRIQS